jgi:hypothetical protein
MGIGCLVNATRCGRLNCYFTGPAFLLAAIFVALAEFRLPPIRPGTFLVILFGVAMVACLTEIPFGRYRAVRRC